MPNIYPWETTVSWSKCTTTGIRIYYPTSLQKMNLMWGPSVANIPLPSMFSTYYGFSSSCAALCLRMKAYSCTWRTNVHNMLQMCIAYCKIMPWRCYFYFWYTKPSLMLHMPRLVSYLNYFFIFTVYCQVWVHGDNLIYGNTQRMKPPLICRTAALFRQI